MFCQCKRPFAVLTTDEGVIHCQCGWPVPTDKIAEALTYRPITPREIMAAWDRPTAMPRMRWPDE
jgi:hypothetical protein